MTPIITKYGTIKRKSPDRHKSLVLYIPAAVRDIMQFEHDTEIAFDVCVENDEKVLRIRKVD